jgi:hypothetical protein
MPGQARPDQAKGPLREGPLREGPQNEGGHTEGVTLGKQRPAHRRRPFGTPTVRPRCAALILRGS